MYFVDRIGQEQIKFGIKYPKSFTDNVLDAFVFASKAKASYRRPPTTKVFIARYYCDGGVVVSSLLFPWKTLSFRYTTR